MSLIWLLPEATKISIYKLPKINLKLSTSKKINDIKKIKRKIANIAKKLYFKY